MLVNPGGKILWHNTQKSCVHVTLIINGLKVSKIEHNCKHKTKKEAWKIAELQNSYELRGKK